MRAAVAQASAHYCGPTVDPDAELPQRAALEEAAAQVSVRKSGHFCEYAGYARVPLRLLPGTRPLV